MGLFDAFRAPRPPQEEIAPQAEALSSELLHDQSATSASTSELLSNYEARPHLCAPAFTRPGYALLIVDRASGVRLSTIPCTYM